MKTEQGECNAFLKHYPEDGIGMTYISCKRPFQHKGRCRGLLDVTDQRGKRFQMEVFWERSGR